MSQDHNLLSITKTILYRSWIARSSLRLLKEVCVKIKQRPWNAELSENYIYKKVDPKKFRRSWLAKSGH